MTVQQLMDVLKTQSPDMEVKGAWEGITAEVNAVVVEGNEIWIDVDEWPNQYLPAPEILYQRKIG